VKTVLHWENLSKEERATYMKLQVSPSGGYDRSGYLPDDCGECGACGQAIVGTGWCHNCYLIWKELDDKLRREPNENSK